MIVGVVRLGKYNNEAVIRYIQEFSLTDQLRIHKSWRISSLTDFTIGCEL